jgi:hypothetical protein
MRKIIDFLLLKNNCFYFEKKVAQNYKFISCYNDHHNEKINKKLQIYYFNSWLLQWKWVSF